MWYNEDLNKLKCDKIDAYNRFKLSDDQMEWSLYKSIRNMYVTQLRDTENNYYSHKVTQNRGDPKKMWSVLKEILGRKSHNTIKSVQIDNNIYNDKQVIADKLNAYFIHSIEQINASIARPSTNIVTNAHVYNVSFKFKQVCVKTIIAAIKQIKSDSELEWLKPEVLLDGVGAIGG